jgi:BirA family biotin operon repressor/biotin-[acetyl-CoA-carboxylase] ligase
MRRIDPGMTRRARNLRGNATEAERIIWRRLCYRRPRFTRQLIIGPYVVDLACRRARLAIELDGSQHLDSAADASRTRYLEARGWRVLRFWNREVTENPEGVAEAIIRKIAEGMGDTED